MNKSEENASFRWTAKASEAALALAEGCTRIEAAERAGVVESTVYRWLQDAEFGEEVDRLSLMVGIASRAERLRIAKKVVRQKINPAGVAETEKDLLDWLRFAQSETQGIKLDLSTLAAAVAEAEAPVAGGGQAGGNTPHSADDG